jgi:hypothetical protein
MESPRTFLLSLTSSSENISTFSSYKLTGNFLNDVFLDDRRNLDRDAVLKALDHEDRKVKAIEIQRVENEVVVLVHERAADLVDNHFVGRVELFD